jgi:hypothetical protein
MSCPKLRIIALLFAHPQKVSNDEELRKKAAISFWGFEAKHEALNRLKELMVKEGVHRIKRG